MDAGSEACFGLADGGVERTGWRERDGGRPFVLRACARSLNRIRVLCRVVRILGVTQG